jgi:hypothetical protein
MYFLLVPGTSFNSCIYLYISAWLWCRTIINVCFPGVDGFAHRFYSVGLVGGEVVAFGYVLRQVE